LNSPKRRALLREAALVRQLLGSGVTALGRANYANGLGQYYIAFFSLSIGLERLAKLILVADYAVSNGGRMPAQEVVKGYGHKIVRLLNMVDAVVEEHALKLDHTRPDSAVITKIVEHLDAFAGRGRYANFATLGDPSLGELEPIQQWWGEVAELILKEHYYGRHARVRVKTKAKRVERMISPAMVLSVNETGVAMRDVLSASIRSGENDIAQRYGQYHVLTIVRWVSEVFSKLATEAYTHEGEAFFGVWEYFQTFTVEDRFLKRKTWS
jgi:hypothetical protein